MFHPASAPPGTFGAELRVGRSSDASSKRRGGAQEVGGAAAGGGGVVSFSEEMDFEEEEEQNGEQFQSEDVEDIFSSSKLPPVQLPLDYNLHLKRGTAALPAKPVKPVKQESVDDNAMEVEQDPKQVKLVKPVISTLTSTQTKPHRVTAAELFTPSEVAKRKLYLVKLAIHL